jgi:hypothetical protein
MDARRFLHLKPTGRLLAAEAANLLKSNVSPDWGFSDDDRSVTLSPLIRISGPAGIEICNGSQGRRM